jgi:RNA polymerase sigma-70 factor (ECF subfamily)
MEFNALLEAERVQLLKYARYLCNYHDADAEDLVQTTIIKAMEHQSSFVLGTNFGGWTSTILRHVFYDQKRRLRNKMPHVQMTSITEKLFTQLKGISYENNLTMALELKQVVEAMELLSANHRRALALYALGFTCVEISEKEKVTEGTIKSRLFRARVELLKILEPRVTA